MKLNVDFIYPIGSLYWNENLINPDEVFGGTWERVKDKFILAVGDTYAEHEEGGEATHTLTIDEMPSHTHGLKGYVPNTGNNNGGFGYFAWATNGNEAWITPTGGGKPHNNMPPYETAYCWKRIA